MVVAYDGSGYAGFQLQANAPTVQGKLELAICKLTGEQLRIRGASRTDAGAHALGQVVDFSTRCSHGVDVIFAALNHHLPDDISVAMAAEVPGEFHARRHATQRRYRYSVLNSRVPHPLLRHSHHVETVALNIDRMRRAASSLLGIRDFRQVATGHPVDQSAVRQVFKWEVNRHNAERDIITIDCVANGFLRHQIRRVNAILIEIGKGRLPIHAMADTLAGRTQTRQQIATLPAKGLCLQSVHYPEYDHLLKVANCNETNQHIFRQGR